MLNRQLGAARDEERHWLERYFLRTRDAARRLGVSPRLLQALASEGPMMLLDHDGRPVEVGLRFVRQRGYWFLREDVERILRARRGAD